MKEKPQFGFCELTVVKYCNQRHNLFFKKKPTHTSSMEVVAMHWRFGRKWMEYLAVLT